MLPNRSHTYHPFKESFLGLYIPRDIVSKDGTGVIIDNINLYYQPVEHPAVVAVFFAIKSVIVLIGEIICMKVLKSMKKEISILDGCMKLYILTLMIHHPFRVLFTTTIDFIHPVSEVIGIWFCSVGRVFIFYNSQVIMYNSFIIALMRYFLIVRNEKIVKFGKDKFAKVCFLFNTGIPILVCILYELSRTELYKLSSWNKCYGNDHKVFLLEDSTYNVMKRKFGWFESYEHDGVLALIRILLKLSIRMTIGAVILVM